MTPKAILSLAAAFGIAYCDAAADEKKEGQKAEGVRYRGLFVNDEDWSLRPWAIRHFGKDEQIGTRAYEEIFRLMERDGLNLIWPAMHEGGYEFSSRPENLALAKRHGITVGTSHCEPMLRNNCYIPKKEQRLWSWTKHRDFVEDYWREGVRRGGTNDVVWTLGMRGIHDGGMKDGTNAAHKIAILEEAFAFQTNLLVSTYGKLPPTLFVPYKEVLPLYNAGLKVPDGTTIMWVNDNFGYIRRLGAVSAASQAAGPADGPAVKQGIYWHLSYHGRPHGYIHLCTTPPAFLWYELVAKCWENGVRDTWMVNAGDVFQAEPLLFAFGRYANDPEAYGVDAQDRVLSEYVDRVLRDVRGLSPADGAARSEGAASADPALRTKLVAHLAEFYTLGFNRKPEHMCVYWTRNLPTSVKADLLDRYHRLLADDLALDAQLSALNSQLSSEYFRVFGFQVRFLALAGVIHLEGKTKAEAEAMLKPLHDRWDALDGGKWAGFWCDTVDERGGKRQRTTFNRWSSQMQWAWNEPPDPNKADKKGVRRADYPATAYRADIAEPTWLEPASESPAADGGRWAVVPGLGTSGRARALLPVRPAAAMGATLVYSLESGDQADKPAGKSLVLQFLPDYALSPELKLGVDVSFDGGKAQFVQVPKSWANIGEHDRVRNAAVQDNFIRVEVKIPNGAKNATVTASVPGVVIDRVGVR